MKITYNLHLNPAPYRTADHVKFHIQKRSDVAGVALCGGIFPASSCSVFSYEFVSRLDEINHCKCCMAEQERDHLLAINFALEFIALARQHQNV